MSPRRWAHEQPNALRLIGEAQRQADAIELEAEDGERSLAARGNADWVGALLGGGRGRQMQGPLTDSVSTTSSTR
jgi:hypothetical protein